MLGWTDHDCYTASFVPPRCRDGGTACACCPLARFAPRAVRDKHVGTGRSPPRLAAHAGSPRLTAPAQPETSQTSGTSEQPRRSPGRRLGEVCICLANGCVERRKPPLTGCPGQGQRSPPATHRALLPKAARSSAAAKHPPRQRNAARRQRKALRPPGTLRTQSLPSPGRSNLPCAAPVRNSRPGHAAVAGWEPKAAARGGGALREVAESAGVPPGLAGAAGEVQAEPTPPAHPDGQAESGSSHVELTLPHGQR